MHFVCFVIIPKEIYDAEKNNEPEAWIQGHIDEMVEKNIDGLDWYVVGGRWNGMLIKDYTPPTTGRDLCYEDRVEDNCVTVEALLDLYKNNYMQAQPDLITSDGHYYPAYPREMSFPDFIKLLEKETGNYVVNIDYHI
jgi:hypothetical protein